VVALPFLALVALAPPGNSPDWSREWPFQLMKLVADVCDRGMSLLGYQKQRPSLRPTTTSSAPARRPNIVFILTDDQDVLLGGTDRMPTLQKEVVQQGITFERAFTVTPICCPSRTTMITGKFPHNRESYTGSYGWCGNFPEVQNKTMGRWMHDAGYRTGMFGKLTNDYGLFCNNKTSLQDWPGGPMTGWDRFLVLCTDNLYHHNQFNNQGETLQLTDAPRDYMTSVIGNHSVAWLKYAAANVHEKPFFAYIAPHAPHVPATAAPWYENVWNGERAPRTPNWNLSVSNQGRHWQIDTQPPMSEVLGRYSDELYVRRLQSVLSVDDIVRDVMDVLRESRVLDNTFVIYTSDHGYNLGQFRLPSGKFQVYENTIRIPFYVRGPGVSHRSSRLLVSNVDIPATFADLAGAVPSLEMDGRSLRPIFGLSEEEEESVAANGAWRTEVLVEYWGMNIVRGDGCHKNFTSPCPALGPMYNLREDDPSNTFVAIRTAGDWVYGEWRASHAQMVPESTNATELYDLNTDMWQTRNLAKFPAHETQRRQLHRRLWGIANCHGKSCP